MCIRDSIGAEERRRPSQRRRWPPLTRPRLKSGERSGYGGSGECDGSGVGLTMSALGVGLGDGAWNVSADTADMEGLILGKALGPGLGGVWKVGGVSGEAAPA